MLRNLRRFEEAGFPLAVSTNKFERLARQLLERLDLAHRFAMIAGADTFAFRKPDPRHVLETIARASGDVANAVMVGDSSNDIDSAKGAGVATIAVTFGYADRPVADMAADLGDFTVLVNNAANDDRHTWDEMTPAYWDDRLNVNLRHQFFAIQAVAPAMIAAEHGSIINVGSSSYMMQEDFFPGYAIAKSGVEGITRTMARTFGPHGVRVNTVLPGWVATERQLEKWWSPEGEEGTLNDQAIKRRIYAKEFVQIILFLAADDGAACTAQQFLIDGGRF